MAFGDLARQDDYAIDPLTGVPLAASPQAQGKFGRIADAIVGGLRNWIETPGRALRGETTPEEAYQWGPATAFGMIAGSKLPGGAAGSGMTKLPGIKAYHGSPHDFDKFDLSKIGTGEGAQAYGHGLYFAENEKVARGYRDALEGKHLYQVNDANAWALGILKAHKNDAERAIADIRARLAKAEDPDSLAHSPQMAEKLKGAIGIIENEGVKRGKMYEVNLNADPKQFLDWDRPLREQPRIVERLPVLAGENQDIPGLFAYRSLSRRLGGDAPMQTGDMAAGSVMSEAGIPGIRYLDQGSRGPAVTFDVGSPRSGFGPYSHYTTRADADAQLALLRKHGFDDAHIKETIVPQTSNYVVFDPGIIDILRKYGLAGAGATGFGTLAAQDNYKQ